MRADDSDLSFGMRLVCSTGNSTVNCQTGTWFFTGGREWITEKFRPRYNRCWMHVLAQEDPVAQLHVELGRLRGSGAWLEMELRQLQILTLASVKQMADGHDGREPRARTRERSLPWRCEPCEVRTGIPCQHGWHSRGTNSRGTISARLGSAAAVAQDPCRRPLLRLRHCIFAGERGDAVE